MFVFFVLMPANEKCLQSNSRCYFIVVVVVAFTFDPPHRTSHTNAYLTVNWQKASSTQQIITIILCLIYACLYSSPKQWRLRLPRIIFGFCCLDAAADAAAAASAFLIRMILLNGCRELHDNHKNEATIYLMIILNDNATFLLEEKTCSTLSISHVTRALFLFITYFLCLFSQTLQKFLCFAMELISSVLNERKK